MTEIASFIGFLRSENYDINNPKNVPRILKFVGSLTERANALDMVFDEINKAWAEAYNKSPWSEQGNYVVPGRFQWPSALKKIGKL
jgi:hypothetical protein